MDFLYQLDHLIQVLEIQNVQIPVSLKEVFFAVRCQRAAAELEIAEIAGPAGLSQRRVTHAKRGASGPVPL